MKNLSLLPCYSLFFTCMLFSSSVTIAIDENTAGKQNNVPELSELSVEIDEEAVMRAIKEKVIFENVVVMDKKLRVHGKARFYDNVHFKNNVKIDDTLSANDAVINNSSISTLSVTDEVIGCDVTVGCNINIPDSTDVAHGNIVKNGTTFIHNFGTNNTFVGENSGNFTMSGTGNNTGVGVNTLAANATGIRNTAIGTDSLAANTAGQLNTAVGSAALGRNSTGDSNTGIGFGALFNTAAGTNNTAVGRSAMNGSVINQTLDRNTSIGSGSLFSIQTGNFNTVLGQAAGIDFLNGNNNIFIGHVAGQTLQNGDNNIYISNDGVEPESNTIRVGNIQTKFFAAGIRGVTTDVADAIPVLIDSNGQLGTTSSSERFKHSIQQMVDESAAILKLNPVSFIYKTDESQTRQFGLIAEEVDKVFPTLVIKDKNGLPYTVRYEILPVLLLNEMKKLVETTVTKDEMQKLIDRIAILEEMLSQIN